MSEPCKEGNPHQQKPFFETLNTGSTKKKGEEVDRSREMTEEDVSGEASRSQGPHQG